MKFNKKDSHFRGNDKRGNDKKGFTLTEVMIGMAVLTIAIVSATNLLIFLMRSNQENVTSLQAYYFAQEGIEAVRNIRDSNWLHNRYWLGDDESARVWGGKLDGEFSVNLVEKRWKQSESLVLRENFAYLSAVAPWEIGDADLGARIFYVNGEASGFGRILKVEPYGEQCAGLSECNAVLVTSIVNWNVGAKEKELSVEAVLTDWKGGAL